MTERGYEINGRLAKDGEVVTTAAYVRIDGGEPVNFIDECGYLKQSITVVPGKARRGVFSRIGNYLSSAWGGGR